MPRKTEYINEKKIGFDEKQKLVREYKKAMAGYQNRLLHAVKNKDLSFFDEEEPPEAPFP
jgi:type III secretory pathway component EscR